MLSVRKSGPNRVDIELTAILDGDMMATALDELVEVSKDITNGVLMYRIPSFSMPTGGAIMAEMIRLPQLFQVISHFNRCAVITDFGWIAATAQVEGALIPGLAIKSFGSNEEKAAEAWLSEIVDPEEDDDDPNVPV